MTALETMERVAPLGPNVAISRKPKEPTPLTGPAAFWSRGETLLTYKEPVSPRTETLLTEPWNMDLQQLIDTQDKEIPTVSYQAWQITGEGALSTDRPDPNGHTIAEYLEDDHPLKTTWMTTIPVEEMTEEQREAYEQFCAEASSHVGLTPYVTLDPQTKSKIEWEQRVVQDSPHITTRLERAPDGGVRVGILGIVLTLDEYKEAAKDYLRTIIAKYGGVPDIDQIEQARANLRAQFDYMREHNIGIPKTWFEDVYLAWDEDPYREREMDLLLHTSVEVILNEDEIEEIRYLASMGIANWSDVPEPVIGYMHRRPGRRLASMSKGTRHDLFYRGELPVNPVDLGTEDTDAALYNKIRFTPRLLNEWLFGGDQPETSIWANTETENMGVMD